jgi:hypothetical protein
LQKFGIGVPIGLLSDGYALIGTLVTIRLWLSTWWVGSTSFFFGVQFSRPIDVMPMGLEQYAAARP